MAKKKKTTKKVAKPTKVSKKTTPKLKKEESSEKFINQPLNLSNSFKDLKLSESYVSLALGAVVVFVIAVLFFVYIRNSKDEVKVNDTTVTVTPTPSESQIVTKDYVMLENDSLWDIAVREYGDGFKWVEIVKVNNFENPDYVPPGTKIKIPVLK